MKSKEVKNKAFVLKAMDTLFNKRDFAAARKFWSPTYIQHSAFVPAGREGLFGVAKKLPPSFKWTPGMITADGDLVMIHSRYSGTGLPTPWTSRTNTVCSTVMSSLATFCSRTRTLTRIESC